MVCVFCHFSPLFRVEKEQKYGEKLCFVQKHFELGGVEGVEALSCNQVRKSNFFITKSPGPGQGLPDLTEKQRKKASRKREKTDSLKNNSGGFADRSEATKIVDFERETEIY